MPLRYPLYPGRGSNLVEAAAASSQHRYDHRVASTAKEDLSPMPSRPSISVCMTAYNGAEHIKEQLESILPELAPEDEVVIVDDGSTDGTREVLESIEDPRVRVILNEKNLGYVRNFEKALTLSTGDVIMLSDQDDIWIPGRVNLMLNALGNGELVASNFRFIGNQPSRIERLRLSAKTTTHRFRNLVLLWLGVRPYYGCAMAMTRRFLEASLPFPGGLTETHDKWLAMLANVRGTIVHLDSETLVRRLHDTNTTPKEFRPLRVILRSRIMLGAMLFKALKRR